jgi:glycosyltransferase involved in cell wall biosynthesis
MRLVMVTPRYGEHVVGGAETGARTLAEHLQADGRVRVEVYSTAASDHLTWHNDMPVGEELVRGVRVRRFGVQEGRSREFFELHARIDALRGRVDPSTAERWLRLNGPYAPELVDAAVDADADVVACYPYLFWTSVETIRRARGPVVLHPAAHDEPLLYLPVFDEAFRRADAFAYHTRAERALLERRALVAARLQAVVGLGVEVPEGLDATSDTARRARARIGVEERGYLCFLGRVDELKGARMLAEWFLVARRRLRRPVRVVLIGPASVELPNAPEVVATGPLPPEERFGLLAGAIAVVVPSAYESFSLALLEAFSLGVPGIVNGRCGPTVEHCVRSGAGLWFEGYASFEAVLRRLVDDERLRARMGENGRRYVETHYRWPLVVDRYVGLLERVASAGTRRATRWRGAAPRRRSDPLPAHAADEPGQKQRAEAPR